jgi:hypothetical protein
MKFSKMVLITFVIILILFIGVGVFIGKSIWQPKSDISYSISSQTVIKQMRELNRLETASFTIEKVIDAGTSGNAFQQFLYGDRILLIAHGEVIAGVDLSKLTDQDISINGSTITVTLPSPQILEVSLDNDQTRVYDRTQGILTHGNKDLESNARSVATQTIQDAACKGGILIQAGDNAKKQLSAFLKALGFSTIRFEVTAGSC